MSKSAIIFHGTGGNPDAAWYSWLGRRLDARGYMVQIPHCPGLNAEPIGDFLPRVLANHRFDEQTVLVGHSGGAALLLAILEHIDTTVVNSVVDPSGGDAAHGRAMFDRLGGTLIVRDDGHFGDYDQAYPTFELLDRLID